MFDALVPLVDPVVVAPDWSGVVASVTGSIGDLPAGLLLVLPAALAVTAVIWGTPKIIGFFKRTAK